MLIEHQGRRPVVHESALVAPTAVLSGDVTVGPHSRVLHGAVLTAESGSIELGSHVIVMEHAVVRASRKFPIRIGNHVLVGPHAHLTGCTIEDEVFIATGAAVFNGATCERASCARVNCIVHINTRLPEGELMPIGWIAVGDPASILPPERWDVIGPALKTQDFAGTVFGIEDAATRSDVMVELTERYGRALARHAGDAIIESGGCCP